MPEITFETAITQFLNLGKNLQEMQSLTGEHVLNTLASWYRDNRIQGAALDADGDMLLLQYGANQMIIITEPTDLRNVRDHDLKYTHQPFRCLDFTRQVFAESDNQEAEFDDSAVHMTITLGFDIADGNEHSASQWIRSPDTIKTGILTFRDKEFAQKYFHVPAQIVSITVEFCG